MFNKTLAFGAVFALTGLAATAWYVISQCSKDIPFDFENDLWLRLIWG